MRDFELALKAAGDPTRTRILKMLEGGGLCVCQVQVVLGLAPSTVSKHLAILKNAGLVKDQRDGKWTEYALAGEQQNPYAKAVLAMLRGPMDRDPTVVADRNRLRDIKRIPLVELCRTETPRPVPRTKLGRRADPSRERSNA
jgi:ArsR family transcriptional regulator, arsenate/arsenite/antimonite-responsive transcriptional repressor